MMKLNIPNINLQQGDGLHKDNHGQLVINLIDHLKTLLGYLYFLQTGR